METTKAESVALKSVSRERNIESLKVKQITERR